MLFLVWDNALLVVKNADAGKSAMEIKYHILALFNHKGYNGGARYIRLLIGRNVECVFVMYLADVRLSALCQFLGNAFLQCPQGTLCLLLNIFLRCDTNGDSE